MLCLEAKTRYSGQVVSAVDRSFWLAAAIVSYVGVAGLQSAPSKAAVGLLLGGPLLLWWLWGRTRARLASPGVELTALASTRVGSAAAICWLHARLGAAGDPGLDLAATSAAGTCAVAGAYALARIAPVRGLLVPAKAARSVDAAAFSAMLWGAALVISLTRFVVPERAPALDPLTLDYATTAAGIGSLLVLIAAAWRVRVMRELELGVADRAEGAVALSVTALSVAIPVAAIDIAPPDRVLPAALIVASLGCCWTVLAPDPAQVSVTLRGTIAVMLLGVPAALMAALFAEQAPTRAGLVALVGCACSIVAGLIARNVARPLGPEQSRWLSSISEANQNALDPEPNSAIAAALRSLKKTSRSPTAVPQLWRLDPPSVISVDVAGYLHEDDAEVPEALCALGLDEPERTLRAETLAALQVRRPEVRPLLSWFEVRGAFCATIVMDDEGPTGFLLLPRGERSARLTLEEARAARTLADRLSSLFSITSALARSRKRELEAQRSAEHWQEEYDKAKRVLDDHGERHREIARTLAHPLLATAFSPGVRLCMTELEHRAKRAGPVFFVAPTGVDADAWAAYCHLQSPRAGGPFLVLDGAAEARQPPARWHTESTSPIALSRGGSLFVRDLHLLPADIQLALLELLTERPPLHPADMPPPRLIASAPVTTTLLTQRGVLQKAFEPVLSKAELQLPTLQERAEDLRALILDAISRAGHGPEGVERSALQLLMDHPWPGNERELRDLVERAGALEQGPLLTVESVRSAGLEASNLDGVIAAATGVMTAATRDRGSLAGAGVDAPPTSDGSWLTPPRTSGSKPPRRRGGRGQRRNRRGG